MDSWSSTRVALLAAAAALLSCDATPFREVRASLAAPPAGAIQAAPVQPPVRTLRVSVAAVESPRDTYSAWGRLFARVGQRLGLEVEFVQRRTYREVNDLLAAGKLDAALVCTGGLLDLRRRAPGAVEVLAVPVTEGGTTYQSLVIVPAASDTRRVEDLAGKRFAFTDELSFSGRLYLVRLLGDLGRDPDRFFGTVVYTQNHDRSIGAVASGTVDGAAVHSLVFGQLVRRDRALAGRVRVIHRSPPFGAMPVVASTRLSPELRHALHHVLLDLAKDDEARAVLRTIGIDGFADPAAGLYDSAARVAEVRR
jgi:phosphonate transport system substrate-binding protein